MKKWISNIRNRILKALLRTMFFLADCKGDLATNTIGGIIVAVVIIGLLIAAINAFFPGFFSGMFNSMSQKLDANW